MLNVFSIHCPKKLTIYPFSHKEHISDEYFTRQF